MSELKHQLTLNKERSWVPCYIKSEADKVIEELKKEKKYAIDNVTEVINTQEREICHQKYKRCLCNAKLCKLKRIDAADYRIPRKSGIFTINGTSVGWNLPRISKRRSDVRVLRKTEQNDSDTY